MKEPRYRTLPVADGPTLENGRVVLVMTGGSGQFVDGAVLRTRGDTVWYVLIFSERFFRTFRVLLQIQQTVPVVIYYIYCKV